MFNTGKRKRRTSDLNADNDILPSSQDTPFSANSINPFSRSPAQLLQYSVAGLGEAQKDPTIDIPDFPHRGFGAGVLRRATSEPASEDAEDGEEEENRNKGFQKTRHHEKQLAALLQSIQLFLDGGHVAKAARVFGLVLQLNPNAQPLDIRHYNLWAIGAEIVMREGEKPSYVADGTLSKPARQIRWGSATNMGKVREYLETLAQQHPFDHKNPHKISALDFHLALISCEIYNVHAEHVIASRHVDDGDLQTGEEDMGEHSDQEESPEVNQASRASIKIKDEYRAQALREMERIAQRMDVLGQGQPFDKNQDFLKLRATASLYMADLVTSLQATSAPEQGQSRRQREHDTAKGALEKIIGLGGHVDPSTLAFFGMDEESEDPPLMMPTYSSLPIREA